MMSVRAETPDSVSNESANGSYSGTDAASDLSMSSSVDGSNSSDVTASSRARESYVCSSSTWESSKSETEWDSDDSDSSSETQSESEDEDPSKNCEPLYEGAEISVVDSCVLLQYSLRHGLTKEAFEELLRLVAVHLPSNAKVPTSAYKLKKLFLEMYPKVKSITYYYCTFCHQFLKGSEPCDNGCMNEKGEFVYIPVGPQLKEKLEDHHIWEALQKRKLHNMPRLSDICDGQEYRKHMLFFSSPGNVSFLLNTDGLALFRSSKKSLWPVWLVMNELPPNERFSKKNMLLVGLWFSSEKPTMACFLRPLMEEMNDLYSNGIRVTTPVGPLNAHAMLLLSSLDLPARSIVLNMKQYNGKYGCCYCESTGTSRESSHMHRDWPYEQNVIQRTHESIRQNAVTAVTSHKVEKGVKGASPLLLHHPFDIVKGTVIDVLHCIFLGVVLHLLHYWFDKSHGRTDYSIRQKIHLCDKQLLSIKVPDIVSRPPKSLLEVTHWKGSQLRAWLLYYSLPVLHGVLPHIYFVHFSFLVAGIHILLSDSLSELDISLADALLIKFYSQCEELYGRNFCAMNVHMLSHLAQCVRNWGPLWAYSCFQFEGMNGQIKGFFHGTREMNKQLAFSYIMAQKLPLLLETRGERVKSLLHIMVEKKG